MELDQVLFKRVHDWYKKISSKNSDANKKGTVSLESLKPRLTILSRALTGFQNEIVTSEREGGWSGLKFFLPTAIYFSDSTEKNLNYYLFRVLYLSIQQKLMLNWEGKEEHKISVSQLKAFESSKEVLPILFEEYPATEEIYIDFKTTLESYYKNKKEEVDYSWLYGRWLWKNPLEFKATTSSPNKKGSKNEDETEITTEIEANPSDEVTVVGLDKKQVEDNVVQNQFEKVDTLSEFNGSFKEMEGDDTLSDDEDAIRELNLKHTVRSDDTVHSIYKAEFVNSSAEIQVEELSDNEKYLSYDEWDYKKKEYKTDFCKVFPKFLSIKREGYAHKEIQEHIKTKRELHKLFARVHNEFEKVSKVISGEDIDLDAVIDTYADIHAKRTPSERIYLTKRKRKKDLAVLILMDTSLSSDGYTNNEHILSVEKNAVLMFGEILNEYDISFQIDSFSSHTRNHCSYNHIKTFKESWHKTRDRIGSVEAEGFTRIGTALRHAGSSLDKEKAQKKWIILLSDGKPNDYDTYEGKYGIEDVKQALRELDKKHIHTFSLAIESQAKYYLPQMFGHQNYNILPKPSDLPVAFSKFYKRIINE